MVVLKKILVKEIMVSQVVTVQVDEPFSRVAELFREHHIRHIPVVEKDGVLAGLITQRDLFRLIPPKRMSQEEIVYDKDSLQANLLRAIHVGEDFFYDKTELDSFVLRHVMVKKVHTCSPEDALGQVVELMVKHKYGCVPIVKDAFLKGIVTHYDVLRSFLSFLV